MAAEKYERLIAFKLNGTKASLTETSVPPMLNPTTSNKLTTLLPQKQHLLIKAHVLVDFLQKNIREISLE